MLVVMPQVGVAAREHLVRGISIRRRGALTARQRSGRNRAARDHNGALTLYYYTYSQLDAKLMAKLDAKREAGRPAAAPPGNANASLPAPAPALSCAPHTYGTIQAAWHSAPTRGAITDHHALR